MGFPNKLTGRFKKKKDHKLFSDDWEGSGIGQYLRREISTPVEAFVLGRGQKDIGGSGNFGGG